MQGIELELKYVRATAVHGWGTLSGIVVGEWLEDISRNQVVVFSYVHLALGPAKHSNVIYFSFFVWQIHKVLKGLGPIRPLFAVGSGAAKLVALPAEQYKRDRRRLLRGMRKGIVLFSRHGMLNKIENL